MPEYLVIATEDIDEENLHEDFAIIEAETPEEAKYLYIIKIGIHNKDFLENVYGRAINWCYATRFWEKLYDFDNYGKPLYDEDKIDDMFKEMVREFFGEHQDWAELFIRHTFGEDLEFPEEMLAFMLLKDEGWVPYIIVPLDELRLK